ncbi:hypothetical protein [Sphingobacterium sp. xlx-130]|uniref:hypothetical protein n=1 Tax=Sphingobacterium sp. xlx-130 TaxID=2654323 RepID=UPI0013DB03B4|nr:hypothetical protein [Sphingobacterium sp. xlx-130]
MQQFFKRGNDFNRKAKENRWYQFDEIYLSNGKRLDSYDAIKEEIFSRKATTLSEIKEDTFKGYLKEMQSKYSAGTIIRSNKYPEIDGQKLVGRQILEIPSSNKTFDKISKYKDIAKKDYNIEIRFRDE